MDIKNYDFYTKSDWGYMHLLWSDNPPSDPETATAVISINLFDNDGNDMDGGELDIQSTDFDLSLYVEECLALMEKSGPYEEIDEDSFFAVCE